MYCDACQKREPVVESSSAIRGPVKVGLLAILDREREHIAFTIAAKKAQTLSCDTFEEIAELVNEVIELEKSLKKVVAIIKMIEEEA